MIKELNRQNYHCALCGGIIGIKTAHKIKNPCIDYGHSPYYDEDYTREDSIKRQIEEKGEYIAVCARCYYPN